MGQQYREMASHIAQGVYSPHRNHHLIRPDDHHQIARVAGNTAAAAQSHLRWCPTGAAVRGGAGGAGGAGSDGGAGGAVGAGGVAAGAVSTGGVAAGAVGASDGVVGVGVPTPHTDVSAIGC